MKKLYSFRFRKIKEMIQIYKIFELQTVILYNLIEYHKNPNLSSKQQKDLLLLKEKIINLKKRRRFNHQKRPSIL